MQIHHNEKPDKNGKRRKTNLFRPLIIACGAVLLGGGWYWYTHHHDAAIPSGAQIKELIGPVRDKIVSLATGDRKQGPIAVSPLPPPGLKQSTSASKGPDNKPVAGKNLSQLSTPPLPEEKNKAANAPDDSRQNGQLPASDELAKNINAFYSHLDHQQYMQGYHLPSPSKIYFSQLLQKLLDHPPIVVRETDDLFTLLKNTAHFFRILGKDNINILKAILHEEKDSFEQTLRAFYLLTYHPEYLEKEYHIKMSFPALQDYAGFFLNTMGGKMYLFRRDSSSRLLVSYYSILVIDRAIDAGDEHHGISLKSAIDNLVDEMENGGGKLRLRQTYLDTLYDLKQKYQ